ncbi:hypothetical protein [Virgibacillus kimchii]
MMPFLYFPEDKSEYLPAIIVLIIFTILAGVAMYLVIKKSKKDEQKFKEQFDQRIKEAEDQN